MAVRVSAGVFTQENDLSFVPQGIAAIGAALIGITEKGPAFNPVSVKSFNDFRTIFGNQNVKMYAPYAAKNYLQNADLLNVVRVLGTTTPVGVGEAVILAFPSVAITSGTTLTSSATAMAVLRARSGTTLTSAAVTGTSNSFTLSINGTSAAGLSVNRSDANYIGKVLGTDPFASAAGDLLTAVYVESTFDYAYFASAGITGSASAGTGYNTGTGGYNNGATPVVVSQNYNGSVYDLFNFETISDGDASNTQVKVSIDVQTSQVSVSSYPQFVVSIRDYSDTDDRSLVLESFTCTLNPNSNDYIKRVIGDRISTFNTSVSPVEVSFDGEFENKSKYVRVVMFSGYPVDAKPSGFKAVPSMLGATFTTPYKLDNTNFAAVKDSKIYMGYDSTAIGASNRLGFLVSSISATSTGTTKGFLVSTLTAENASTGSLTSSYVLVNASTGNPATATTLFNSIKVTVPFYGGWDGFDERKDKLQLMVDGTLSADYYNAIQLLSNSDEIDFNLLCIPGVFAGGPATQGSIPSKAIDMVQSRGDAFYIMDMGDNTITTVTGAVMNSTVDGVVETAKAFDTNYAASYFPSVRILDTDNNKFVWVPASVVVFGAYAFNDKVGQPWYAVAGLNRGVLNVFEARKRLTQTQRDVLYVGKTNPIATFANQGITVWGQKTLQTKASALDRINVRRLLLTARKLISSVAKFFVFEPNNAKLRSDIVNAINPILDRMAKLNALEQFRVICDETNNTPDSIDRNIINANIFLSPVRSGEIFLINFSITRSGVSFNE